MIEIRLKSYLSCIPLKFLKPEEMSLQAVIRSVIDSESGDVDYKN